MPISLARCRKLANSNWPKLDDLAQGRIWTGAQAVEHKLIDRLGSFSDAVEEARALVSKLDGASNSQELPIKYVGRKISPIEKFVQKFMGQSGWLAGESNGHTHLERDVCAFWV